MGKSYDLRKGKQYFRWLIGGILLVTVLNTGYEAVFGLSYPILGVQAFILLAMLGVAVTLFNGQKRKNLFFAILLVVGMFTFYQAGSRMPDLSREEMEITYPPVLTLCIGLGYILSAIYLSYSPEIDMFLKEKQAERDRLIQESY